MQRINEKIMIGNMELNGRIMMPSVATYQCDEDGLVTETVCDYYAQRAKNPYVGLIITEHSYVSEQGKAKKHQMSIASDACIPGLRNLVDVIHQNGAKVFAQLNHAGSASPEDVINGKAVAPSSVVLPVQPSIGNGALPLELTVKEIAQIVIQFAESAIRAKEAGYDGVEIHSAHAYLLNQFYSPLTNHRSDEYGESLINRLKIHREVIHAVRKAVGDDYPISVRIGGCDYRDGGSTIEDSVEACKIFANESVDLLNVSGGMCRYIRKGYTAPGYFKDMSSKIKSEVSIPIILTGGVTKIVEVEGLLKEDAADLIGVGRALLKDACWQGK